jgi:hypothetical protein
MKKTKKMNKWETLKNYINSKEIGSIITRKSLGHRIFNGPYPRTSSYGSTVDNYRRCLTKLGILSHVGIGQYKLNYYIREDLSSSELIKMAYGGFTEWFNDAKVEGKANE